MAESELYKKGEAIRRRLRGEEDFARDKPNTTADPVMKKFIDVATETVFGSLWTRPGLDMKTRTLDLRRLGRGDRAPSRARYSPALRPRSRAGPRTS